ncbi:hypothetical protein HYDPIDRAFT_141424 [Hydnomerulius pinastri MD-312]|uniref:Unplaced genomic scaffold scaffold_88, whole genome shotgun sequence n=1 Tax=Hydnomerulius pinastri MD-312 TaxID=994086 RepID=A0A0C9W718_9AGAM|nr:hypothetical protein HYDPIDRAFT_141424 [Hydnomerulius pinastri MD-312]
MYHLLKGFHEYLTRKEELSIIIIGVDGARKTVRAHSRGMLPSLSAEDRGSLVGLSESAKQQARGDLLGRLFGMGYCGQRGIRLIWHRYHDNCHAIVYAIDAQDRERLGEGWEVFDTVLSTPQILNVPLLLLNKQDTPHSLSATEIRQDYEVWEHHRRESARWTYRSSTSAANDSEDEGEGRKRRIASLDVVGVSALEGQGVREIVDRLFLGAQNRRQ